LQKQRFRAGAISEGGGSSERESALSDRVLAIAGGLLPPELRSLDAIHLATASLLGETLGKVVTYDARMADAARQLGWSVVAPA
jgi:predicted nucleic acid-binding protein